MFRGGFTRGAADAVAGANPVILASLVNKSFLQREAVGTRYTIHELMRQYAEAKLQESPSETSETRNRHASYYAKLLGEESARPRSKGQRDALATIDSEISNVRTAWSWMLADYRVPDIGAMMDALSLFYERRASRTEAVATFRGAAAVLTAPERPPTAESEQIASKAFSLQATFAWEQGSYDGLRDLIRMAIHLSSGRHRREHALALITAAAAAGPSDTAEQCDAWIEEGLALYRATEDRSGLARALITLGRRYLNHERLQEAERVLRESIAIQESSGDGAVIPDALVLLGRTRAARGHQREGLLSA